MLHVEKAETVPAVVIKVYPGQSNVDDATLGPYCPAPRTLSTTTLRICNGWAEGGTMAPVPGITIIISIGVGN